MPRQTKKGTTHPRVDATALLQELSKNALIDMVCDAMECVEGHCDWSLGDLKAFVNPRLVVRKDKEL